MGAYVRPSVWEDTLDFGTVADGGLAVAVTQPSGLGADDSIVVSFPNVGLTIGEYLVPQPQPPSGVAITYRNQSGVGHTRNGVQVRCRIIR